MRFENPNLLWLLLILPPVLTAFLWWAWKRKRVLLTEFIEARLLESLISGVSPARRKVRLALLVGAVVCLIITMARPQWGFSWEETKQRGLDVVVAIDTSKSMLAEDIAPNRLARAKLAALDLMQQAKSDRLGLIVFAGSAFMQCPLTVDDVAFRQSVESLNVNTIPQGGTAIAEAIDTAMNAFKHDADNHRVLVIFTDGEDHDPGAVGAATKAAEAGMRIFAVGIGSAEGELLRVKDAAGNTDYVRDEAGNVVKSRLNEPLLQEIARIGNGFYLPLRGANTMDMLYERGLAPLPKSESTAKLVKRYHERFYWPLFLAIACLLAELLIPERKRGKEIKSNSRLQPREGENRSSATRESMIVGMAIGLLTFPFAASASPSSALRDYNAGKFDKALQEYQQALEKRKDDPRLQYNAGAAAYRDGQFNEAAKHFGQALAAPDLKLQERAYYNLGNALYRAGEGIPDPQKQIESWESAVKQYDSAIKLGTNSADAKFNRDFVRKRLEELKQQQQQQQKQDQQNKDQDQQKDQQQNQKQDQQKQDQQKQQQQDQQQAGNNQSQNPDQQKKEQQQANQSDQQKSESKEDQQRAGQQKQEQRAKAENEKRQQQEQSTAQSGSEEEKEQNTGQGTDAYAQGQLTPQQARRLLDSLKSDEIMLPAQPDVKPSRSTQVIKDW